MPRNVLGEFIELVVERRVREASITGGKRVPFGSREHINDLEQRIADLDAWRQRQKRGSEARANYSRLISRLKSELASARRVAEKTRPKKLQEGTPWEELQDTSIISTRTATSRLQS